MKLKKFTFFILTFILSLDLFVSLVSAEEKLPPGRIIPKIPQTANDPELFNGHVYPEWGPICQRYTYSVVYRDKEGRPPEYIKIYFNGEMIDMDPTSPEASLGKKDYQQGVLYEYKYVPKKLGSNFYYFEASNGLGKVRDSIIDSPDNGPVLFESAFDKNEIVLIDAQSKEVIWRYSTGKEWVGGVALSDDGQYLAALTSQHVYLFSTESDKPLWQYQFAQSSPIGGGPRGNGVALSGDGSRIVAATGMEITLFGREKNEPLWKHKTPAIAVAISQDGEYAAASSVGEGLSEAVNVLLLWQTSNPQPIWEFTSDSNFHDVSLSANGQYLAASTGCPDRKAYIFSKKSREPLVQSERLTLDSPVSKSKISADGRLAAFATEGGPDSSVVVLFSNNSSQPLWKFDNQKRNSSRALSLTSDGRFAAAATMQGDVYLLGTENNAPLKNWSLNTSVGALDLAEDGSFLALGGTDKQVHLLPREGNAKKISVNEFIQTIDISGNGRYVAVGTGGSVYFFEDYLTSSKDKVFECETIIEPSQQGMAMDSYGSTGTLSPEETKESKEFFPVLGGGVLLVILGFVTYWLGVRLRPSLFKGRRRLFFLTVVFSFLAVVFVIYQLRFGFLRPKTPSVVTPEKSESITGQPTGEAVCGNSLCEPDLGESKESCLQDCSAGD